MEIEWTFDRIREACEKVAMDDIGRLGIAQEIPLTSCGGSSRQSTGWEESFSRTFARKASVSRLMTTCGGYRRDTETATTGGVRLVEANTNGERQTGYWVQIGVNANEAKVFRAHAVPLELCDNLINALELLTNQQKDGDRPIQSIACTKEAEEASWTG